MALPAHAADPAFTTSTATYAPEPALAGSVVRYDVAITNTGGDSRYTRIVVVLPQGYFIGSGGDCAHAQPGDDGRFVLYEGSFPAGTRKQCQVSLLPRPDAAGSIATLAVEITTPPAGYFRLEAWPTLAGPPPPPDTVFVAPIGITPADMVTLALLAPAVVGALAVARKTRDRIDPALLARPGQCQDRDARTRPRGRLLLRPAAVARARPGGLDADEIVAREGHDGRSIVRDEERHGGRRQCWTNRWPRDSSCRTQACRGGETHWRRPRRAAAVALP